MNSYKDPGPGGPNPPSPEPEQGREPPYLLSCTGIDSDLNRTLPTPRIFFSYTSKRAMKVSTVLATVAACAAAATGAAAAPLASSNSGYYPPTTPPNNVKWVWGGCLPSSANPNMQCTYSTKYYSGDLAGDLTPDGQQCGDPTAAFWCGSFVDPTKSFYPGESTDYILPAYARWHYVGCSSTSAPLSCPANVQVYQTYHGQTPDNTQCAQGTGLWCGY
ncbi:hypothetical protein DFJ74DRAFT_681213 [Hyaloraphidium curvatum]|nr:hypothetical protein DFJ74DRAFT_681213 [Hyaloraphidium curvatum]